ncbi:MAG: hypothetical protein J5784_03000 [Muribaculaceae bacterium]|nr:hypothetical protein [Muribaculaceae bacterium]
MDNKRYFIKLDVITPLAIGAGGEKDWAKGLDYVEKDGNVYILDLAKMAAAGVDIDRMTSLFLKMDHNGVINLLGNKLDAVSARIFRKPTTTANPIKSFIRSQMNDTPLVPGSSLKGAIRSILFESFRDNERDNVAVFGELKGGADFMRFVKVGDIEMSQTLLVNTNIFNRHQYGNEWTGGWKKGNNTNYNFSPSQFNTIYEVVPPGDKGFGTIVLSKGLFEKFVEFVEEHNRTVRKNEKIISIPHKDEKRSLLDGGIRKLFAIINEHTRNYLNKELRFFEQLPAERTDEIVNSIKSLLEMIPSDNSSCILKMSAGSGFHSITGDWQFNDYVNTGKWDNEKGPHYRGVPKYKSRKIVEYDGKLGLMGFVRLSEIDPEVIKNIAEEKKAAKEEAQRKEAERLAAEKAELLKRQKLEEEQRRQEAMLYDLRAEFRNLLQMDDWNGILSKSASLDNFFLADSEISDFISKAKNLENIHNARAAEEAAKKQMYSQPLSSLLPEQPSSSGQLLGIVEKWVKNGNTMSEDEIPMLAKSINALIAKTKEREKSKVLNDCKRRIRSSLGEDIASKIEKLL